MNKSLTKFSYWAISECTVCMTELINYSTILLILQNKRSLTLLELFNMELHLLKKVSLVRMYRNRRVDFMLSFFSTLQFLHSVMTSSNTRIMLCEHKTELSLHSSSTGNVSFAILWLCKTHQNSLSFCWSGFPTVWALECAALTEWFSHFKTVIFVILNPSVLIMCRREESRMKPMDWIQISPRKMLPVELDSWAWTNLWNKIKSHHRHGRIFLSSQWTFLKLSSFSGPSKYGSAKAITYKHFPYLIWSL